MMEALKMETPMTEWNNDRLDEMNGRMKEGFAEVDKRFTEVNKRFEKVEEKMATKEEMAEVRSELRQLNARFDRFLSILVAACFGMVGSVFVAALGVFLQS